MFLATFSDHKALHEKKNRDSQYSSLESVTHSKMWDEENWDQFLARWDLKASHEHLESCDIKMYD